MRDPFQWSIGLGRWGGVTVRLHVFFLAFAAATFYFCWPSTPSARSVTHWWMVGGNMLGIASAAVAVLFLSVLAHELSHWLMARHAGVPPETITIGPLGGLTVWRSPVSPRVELAVLAAGPLANLLLALLLSAAILAQRPDLDIRFLFNPLQPAGMLYLSQGLTVGLWINWLLFLVNSLPAYPFDGGRILRALLLAARPAWSERHVAEWVCGVAVALSVVFATIATVLAKHDTDSPFPIWSALLLLAVVLLVSARREMDDVNAFVPVEEPVEGEGEAAATRPGAPPLIDAPFTEPPVAGMDWEPDMDGADAPARREEMEAAEERQVDAILSRLHAHGMDSLTVDERAMLDRVSARYRSRLGKRT
jgi:stage IV sporulation protein FB